MNDLKINPETGNIEIDYVSGIQEITRRIYARLGCLVGQKVDEITCETAAMIIMDEFQHVQDSMSVPTATGADLDKLAELWGITRRYSETDDQLRHRTRALAVDDGYLGIELPEGLVDIDKLEVEDPMFKEYGSSIPDNRGKFIREKKCECGSAALGYTQPGPGHASYCPLATK